jgi:hypothetical protein
MAWHPLYFCTLRAHAAAAALACRLGRQRARVTQQQLAQRQQHFTISSSSSSVEWEGRIRMRQQLLWAEQLAASQVIAVLLQLCFQCIQFQGAAGMKVCRAMQKDVVSLQQECDNCLFAVFTSTGCWVSRAVFITFTFASIKTSEARCC